MRDIPEEACCSICGHEGPFPPFFPGASLRECRCPACGSSRRNRDVARVLMQCLSLPEQGRALADSLDALSSLRIYELQAKGALHSLLCRLPGYVCSEYLREIKPGECNSEGVHCQDATKLTFPDASFDVVISQDIMEHIEDSWRAFQEIARVLRPGGVHVFTVPLHENTATRQRAVSGSEGEVEHLLLPVYHKDPLDPLGALVFWDYGDDLPGILNRNGIAVRKALHVPFYSPEEVCNVHDQASWEGCVQACEQGRQVSFFLYNSVVFVAGG